MLMNPFGRKNQSARTASSFDHKTSRGRAERELGLWWWTASRTCSLALLAEEPPMASTRHYRNMQSLSLMINSKDYLLQIQLLEW